MCFKRWIGICIKQFDFNAYLDCLGCAILFLEGGRFFWGGNHSGPITLVLFPIEEDFSSKFSSDFDGIIVFSRWANVKKHKLVSLHFRGRCSFRIANTVFIV
jgi:hypothetical protein